MNDSTILALRRERERRGWSRSYVAEYIEVDVITVGRWERGERMPHPHHRQQLCTLFEMNAQDLGLIARRYQDSDETTIDLDPSSEAPATITVTPDPSSEAPATITVTPDPSSETHDATISSSSQQTSSTSTQALNHSSWVSPNRRKLLLAGLGGLGAIASLAGGSLLFTSRSSSPATPIIMPRDKLSSHLLDPNTNNWVNYMAWSPDNSLMALGYAMPMVSIWDIKHNAPALYYPTSNEWEWVNDISWSKTNLIAAAIANGQTGSLKLWQYPDPQPIVTVTRPYGLRSVSWSPDSKYLAISGRISTVAVWDPHISKLISQYSYPALGTLGIRRVKWSTLGKFLACATDDGTAHVWEALTGQPITIYHGHKSRLIDLSWSPDEKYIVSSGTDKTGQIWEAFSGRHIVTYQGHTNDVEGVAWSPRGKYIASASDDRTAHVWEAFTGKLVAKYVGYNCIVEAVCWSADGTTLAIATEKEGVDIWQAPSY